MKDTTQRITIIVILTVLMAVLVACSGGGGGEDSANASDSDSTIADNPTVVVENTSAPEDPAADANEQETDTEAAEDPAITPDVEAPTDEDNAQDPPTAVAEANNAGNQQAAATPEPALPLNDNGIQIVATVNGEPITLPEFERAFARGRGRVDAGSYDMLATNELNLLIEQRLINQAAVELNISVSDEEIEEEYQATRDQVNSDAEWQAWLDQNNFTEAEYRQSLHDALLTRRMIETVTEVGGEVVMEINARHILVETEEEALAVIERLNNGEAFTALAAELSRDVTSSEEGGDLGWFTEDELLTPELPAYAMQLEPGELGQPVQTMLGYHVIEVLGFREREAIPAEQADLAAEQFAEWLQEQLAIADIERFIEL